MALFIWDGAYLYKMVALKVKGATTSLEDGFYGYLPCLGSMFSTEITSNIATMVTVPFVMSCYNRYVNKGFTGRLQIASGLLPSSVFEPQRLGCIFTLNHRNTAYFY